MKLTVSQLRSIIRESLGGSHPNESYDKDLMDDDAFNSKSVMVPDDIKDPIRKWMKSMGMTSKKKSRARSS